MAHGFLLLKTKKQRLNGERGKKRTCHPFFDKQDKVSPLRPGSSGKRNVWCYGRLQVRASIWTKKKRKAFTYQHRNGRRQLASN